jgi:rhodanese-related sulfurtransferase
MWFNRGVHSVGAKQWKEWVAENDAVILDVREPHEWRQGTLERATKIRLSDLPGKLDQLDTDTAILVICRSGARSGRAAGYLAGQGFATVGNLSGGLRALGMA